MQLHRMFALALLLVSISGRGFTQSCSAPSFPSPTPAPIDLTTCGPDGKGGPETAQNQAKNNFCAPAPAKSITIPQMVSLQKQVQNNKGIPFGDTGKHPLTKKAGPATDRTPLVAMGEGNQVVLTGFVKVARPEGAENVNCGTGGDVPDKPEFHDIHIAIVSKVTDPECSGVVVEMIPHHRPSQWTAELVEEVAQAKLPVRVTGQLMFDSSHTPCVKGKPVSTGGKAHDPARVSLWEVHPIYQFEVCTNGDCSSGGWVPLETWSKPEQHPAAD